MLLREPSDPLPGIEASSSSPALTLVLGKGDDGYSAVSSVLHEHSSSKIVNLLSPGYSNLTPFSIAEILRTEDVNDTPIPNRVKLAKRSVVCGWVLVGVGGSRHGDDVTEVG
jgi:hypothetical protein